MTDYLSFPGDILLGVASPDSSERRGAWNAILQTGAQLAWSQARPELSQVLSQQLGRGDLLAPGWTLYNLDLRLTEQIRLARGQGAASVSGAIPMQLRVGPNLLIATSTTPTKFGSDFDPRFSVDFGIAIDFSLIVIPNRMRLSVEIGSAHVTGADCTGNPHIDSQNFVGDVAKFLAEVASPFFGGPNYVQMVETVVGQHDFSGVLNQALQPVNDALGQLAAQGIGAITAFFPDAALPAGLSTQAVGMGVASPPDLAPLVVLATPVSGEGVISGHVRWLRSEGEPALVPPYVGAFTLTASVDRGASQGDFSQSTDVTHLGTFEDASSDTEHVVGYVLQGLPINEPITVECHSEPGVEWTGAAATMIRQIEMDGWKGRVTVLPAPDFLGTVNVDNSEIHIHPIGGQGPDVSGPVDEANGELISIADQVELNPQPIPPGHAAALGSAGVTGIEIPLAATSVLTGRLSVANDHPQVPEIQPIAARLRQDPSGPHAVVDIDFRVNLVTKPA